MSRDPKTAEATRAQVVSCRAPVAREAAGRCSSRDARRSSSSAKDSGRHSRARSSTPPIATASPSMRSTRNPEYVRSRIDAALARRTDRRERPASTIADLAARSHAGARRSRSLLRRSASRRPDPVTANFIPYRCASSGRVQHVRSRSGYWAPDTRPLAASRRKSRRCRETWCRSAPSRSSPYIRPWIGMSRGPDGLTNVTVTWEPGAAPPRNQRVASITVKATASDGTVLFERPDWCRRHRSRDVQRAAWIHRARNGPPEQQRCTRSTPTTAASLSRTCR